MFNRLQMKIIDVKNKIHRAKHGYSYSDVWNMFDWFLEVMPPMLTKLRDEGIGVPQDLWLEGAENEREKWEVILTEMISLLTLMNEDGARKHLEIRDDDYSVGSYRAVHNLMEESKNCFFELFSKYFYNLWD